MANLLSNLFYTPAPEEQKPADVGTLKLLGIMRIVFAYCMLHTVTFGHIMFAPIHYPHSFWLPVSMSFLLGGPPEAAIIQWGSIVAIISTVLLGVGLFTRWMGPLCFIACTLMLCISFSYGRLNHNTNTVPLVLLIFSFTDWGYCYSLDALIRKWKKKPEKLLRTLHPEWFVWLTLATFSLPYLTTGMFKVARGYFMETGYISALIRYKQVFWEQHLSPQVPAIPASVKALQEFVIAHPLLSDSFIWSTLFVEVFFFLALMSRTSRMFMLAMALAMHSMITLTTKVYFLEHMFMLALLLAISLILWWRDYPGLFQRLFPKTPLVADTIDDTPPPAWKKTAWAYGLFFIAMIVVVRLPLPAIPLETWDKFHALHAGYKFFPTDSYLFWYVNDQIIGAAFLVFSATVIAWLVGGYFIRFVQVVFLQSHLKKPHKRILIYDGDCGFCQQWVNWAILRGADKNNGVTFTPYQRSPELLAKTGLTEEDCIRYAVFVEFNEQDELVCMQKSAGSINAVMRHLPGGGNTLYRAFGMVYLLDGIKQLEELGYLIVAKNRHRLGSPNCEI